MKHQFDTEFTLQFYGCDQGIHMMVYRAGEPLTCKKERLKSMRDFLAQPKGTAFKGGFKLEKQIDTINVIAKKKNVGSVPTSVFEQAIKKAKSLPYYVPDN